MPQSGRGGGGLHRLKVTIETSPLIYFLAGTLGFFATIATIGTFLQLYWAFNDRQEELRSAREERIARSWSHLLTRNGGDTGKGGSLSSLSRDGAPIENVDLSCRSIGDWAEDRCATRPRFVSAVLRPDYPEATPNFSDATIIRSEFRGVSVNSKRFHGTWLFETNLRMSRIEPGLESTIIAYSDLTDAEIDMESLGVINHSNISAARINLSSASVKRHPGTEGIIDWLEAKPMSTNWFWADRPPAVFQRDYTGPDVKSLARLLEVLGATICDPRNRMKETNADWTLWNSGLKDLPDPGERRPRLMNAKSSSNLCQTISVEQAAQLFPDSYTESYRVQVVQRGQGGGAEKQKAQSIY